MAIDMIIAYLKRQFSFFYLISLVTTYLLGVGFVQYVGVVTSWAVLIQGLIFYLLIIFSIVFLRGLQALVDPNNWSKELTLRYIKQLRLTFAALTATFLTVATTIFISWMGAGVIGQAMVLLLLAISFVGMLFFLERVLKKFLLFVVLIEVLLFVVIPPALAVFLQSEPPHRLLSLVVIGLVPGYLANRLLTQIKYYANDYKLEVQTTAIQIGWENAMFFHNALILLSYVIFALIALLGFPWFLIWPVFLTLPIGLVSIWLLEQVKRGMKPLWGIMQFASACVFFLPILLIGSAFWLR